jgi:hypothetical protein
LSDVYFCACDESIIICNYNYNQHGLGILWTKSPDFSFICMSGLTVLKFAKVFDLTNFYNNAQSWKSGFPIYWQLSSKIWSKVSPNCYRNPSSETRVIHMHIGLNNYFHSTLRGWQLGFRKQRKKGNCKILAWLGILKGRIPIYFTLWYQLDLRNVFRMF